MSSNLYISRVIIPASVLIGATTLLFTMTTTFAFAQVNGSQVSLAPNGQTMVKGARVVSVSQHVITATTDWGAAKLTWKIVTTGSTRFLPSITSREMLSQLKPGHEISFTGTVDSDEKGLTVRATAVKNSSLIEEAVILGGDVVSTSDTRITILTETGTSSIAVGTGTLMTLDGESVSINELTTNHTLKAFGTFNHISGILKADRIMVASNRAASPEPQKAATRSSIFSSIMAWLSRGSGALGIR